MFVGEMPDQVGHGPLRVRGTELPLIISDGVHALGERRLRGEEDRDQVIGKHRPSLRVSFEPNEAGFSRPWAKSLVRRQPVGTRPLQTRSAGRGFAPR
jgi:hypothetical protein